ncbi:MAG: hypothetical protein MZW92_15540 [Comamonadaceae bacterium]|nr:hypothetical protein [Comamonadaceae bacterium]
MAWIATSRERRQVGGSAEGERGALRCVLRRQPAGGLHRAHERRPFRCRQREVRKAVRLAGQRTDRQDLARGRPVARCAGPPCLAGTAATRNPDVRLPGGMAAARRRIA